MATDTLAAGVHGMDVESEASLRERLRSDPSHFGSVLADFRDRLRRMVDLRLDPRLRARLDASDVVQEACVEAVERVSDWIDGETMPLHLWLRFITGQKLIQLHRLHLGAEMRDARREVPLYGGAPDASGVSVASAIADSGALTPRAAALGAEAIERLRTALESMKREDREVLVMRHFEHLTNGDVARLLGLTSGGASLRFMRAAKRLREILDEVSGGKG
jgi:RNA polymerase sigma-70 factor (ECF subfamily)